MNVSIDGMFAQIERQSRGAGAHKLLPDLLRALRLLREDPSRLEEFFSAWSVETDKPGTLWIPALERLPEPMEDYPDRSKPVLVRMIDGRSVIAQAEFQANERRRWIVVEHRGEASYMIEQTKWMAIPA